LPLIKTEDIIKIYKMGKVDVWALRGVSIEVEEQEFVAVMGPSGSGKSTLMHILGCLDKPTKGRYFLDGIEISTLSEDELAEIRKNKVGFVFQTFNLLPRLRAWENVALPLIYKGFSEKEQRKKAYEMLDVVGLLDRKNHRPTELSGGEAQRVAIARALVNNPRIILADEPTGNLDSKTGKEIMKIFKELNKQKRTIIVVTHDPEIAKNAERIVKIRDGEIVSS